MPQVPGVGNVAGSGKSTLRPPHGAPSFVYSLAQRRTLGRDLGVVFWRYLVFGCTFVIVIETYGGE